VFGLLVSLKDDLYHLEDIKSNIGIDLRDCLFSPGLFVEGVFVIAEGEFSDADGIFKVSAIALPPSESREETKQFLSNLDFFAPVQRSFARTKYARFQTNEASMDKEIPENAEFLILSEVYLDKPKVLEKLHTLFVEYENNPPTCIVLMGNFSSNQSSYAENISQLKLACSKFADMVSSFPNISQHCKFILIPGTSDPGGTIVNILPLPPLPSIIVQPIKEKLKNVHFGSNPLRIRYYGQDIVLFREDLVNRMRRHCVHDPVNQENITEVTQHLVKTLLEQSHLCPMPPHIRPIYWNFDHCMFLYPIPDTLILADRYDQFEHIFEDCICFNPGSFTSDFSFVTYSPRGKKPQFSRIDD